MPLNKITNLGRQKLANAAGTANLVEISHVALGDSEGQAYAPWSAMTALRNERVRRAIDTRYFVDDDAWMIRCAFPPDTPRFEVLEIGYFDTDGDLIAVTAGLDMVDQETGGVTYNLEFVLDFSAVVDGAVIVNAPDDELVNLGLATLTLQATNTLQLFKQAEAWRARFGRYPGA